MSAQFTLDVDPLDALAEPHLAVPAVAKKLSIHQSTVWRWIIRGLGGIKLATFTVGGKRLVREESLREFLRRRNAMSAGESPDAVIPAASTRRRRREVVAADHELASEGL